MRVGELDYDLPAELVAQQPAEPRDASRLLVVDRAADRPRHRTFREIVQELRGGDCLVLNDTRVLPARFFARRETGGRVEVFFLRCDASGWRVLLAPSARLRAGESLRVERDAGAGLVLVERAERGEWLVAPRPPIDPLALLERVGQTPLPPYIRRKAAPDERDRARYQTVYAASPGAVAAPTAGLHFTPELLHHLDAMGVRTARVTLHVGLGTFAPVVVDDLDDHAMHEEPFAVSAEALQALRETRRYGGRIVAVGTTSCRVLESIDLAAAGPLQGSTRLLIQPGYAFRNTDALLTNFHLPRSTLLALVMALGGVDRIRRAYQEAIAARYRFFSYGDAMLIA